VRSQRGSGLLLAMLAMLALIAASTGAMVAIVIAHSQRVMYQQHGVQALYLAEMGVEEMLTTVADGRRPAPIARTVSWPREVGETLVPAPDVSRGERLSPAADARAPIGSYRVAAQVAGRTLTVISTGFVTVPNGRLVTREVRVVCRRQAGRWVVGGWEQTP